MSTTDLAAHYILGEDACAACGYPTPREDMRTRHVHGVEQLVCRDCRIDIDEAAALDWRAQYGGGDR